MIWISLPRYSWRAWLRHRAPRAAAPRSCATSAVRMRALRPLPRAAGLVARTEGIRCGPPLEEHAQQIPAAVDSSPPLQAWAGINRRYDPSRAHRRAQMHGWRRRILRVPRERMKPALDSHGLRLPQRRVGPGWIPEMRYTASMFSELRTFRIRERRNHVQDPRS